MILQNRKLYNFIFFSFISIFQWKKKEKNRPFLWDVTQTLTFEITFPFVSYNASSIKVA